MADDGTLVGEIGALLSGDVPAYATLPLELVGGALPAVLELLDGQETAEEIAAPYLRILFSLGLNVLEDLIAKKPAADVRKAFDDGVGDLLEQIRFGEKPSTAVAP
jgi:hypothetical protein